MAVNADALVLLPALLCDSRAFQHQLDAFSDDLPVLVPDVGDHDSFGAMAQTLLQSLPTRFALAGNSMGGYLALEILRQAPDRVSHLALIGTNAHADPPEARKKREQAIRLAEAGKFDQFIEGYVEAALHPALVEQLSGEMVAMARTLGPKVLIRHQHAIMARLDSGLLLSSISVPTAVVCGAQDTLSLPEVHRDMAANISKADYAIIDRCGHLVPLEAPDTMTGILKNLLMR